MNEHKVPNNVLWEHSRKQVIDKLGVVDALQKAFKTPDDFYEALALDTDEELLCTKYRIQQNYES